MLGIQGIFAILNKQSYNPRTIMLPLEKASGRLLANTIVSPLDSPPFDKSAMDGWAICAGDEQGPWKIIETVAAGRTAKKPLKQGCCTAIMTGAKIPDNCKKVIRVEYARQEDGVVYLEEPETLANIILKGENLKAGSPVLGPRRLKPSDIGILASIGMPQVPVALTPRIGIITTGSEIREAGEALDDGEIYNSNGPQLLAQAEGLSCRTKYYGIIPDEETQLETAIARALDENDVLLLSGGVSMGEFDFIPGILEKLSVKKEFHRAAIKPGRPLWFGSRDDCFVFGLPGNPVSTYILFEVFVKHLVWKFCGLDYKPDILRAQLGKPVIRHSLDRTEFLPVQFRDETVWPVHYHGSSHLNAMGEADGLIIVDQGIASLEEGAVVHVRLL